MNPPEFACNMCGKCCTGGSDELGVVLVPEDIERMARHLGKSTGEFIEAYCDGPPCLDTPAIALRQLRMEDGHCVFLQADNACAVHEVKPLQCSTGPFGMFWDGELRYDCMRQIPEQSLERARAETAQECAAYFSKFLTSTSKR